MSASRRVEGVLWTTTQLPDGTKYDLKFLVDMADSRIIQASVTSITLPKGS